jgi:hypothetical protein
VDIVFVDVHKKKFTIWFHRPIKMCVNKICGKVHVGKRLCDALPIQKGLIKEMLYHNRFSTLF